MFQLTNRNVRLRFLAAKDLMKALGTSFTYADMAEKFDTDDRTVYTWITAKPKLQHLPTNKSKRAKLSAWINDGTLKGTK